MTFRFPRRNDATVFSAPSEDDYQDSAQRIHSNRDTAVFSGIIVCNGERVVIREYRRRIRKIDTVFTEIDSGFGGVPFVGHGVIVCTTVQIGKRQFSTSQFHIPNEFVFGYGLDLDELYRNLPFIGVVRD